MVCAHKLTDADGYCVAFCVLWRGIKLTVPSTCGGNDDNAIRHAKWCCRNHVMEAVIRKARELWRKDGGPKCIKITTMGELNELRDAFKEGLEEMGSQLWSAVSSKTPDALKSCCFIAVVVLRIVVGTTNAMPLRIVKMFAAGDLHILLPASDILETTRLKMGLAYKESVPERLQCLENEHIGTKKDVAELQRTQEEMMKQLVALQDAMDKLAGSPKLRRELCPRQRYVTVVGTPVADAGTPVAAVAPAPDGDPRSPAWAATLRLKRLLETPRWLAARIENQIEHIDTEVVPIKSLLSRILPVACTIVALLLSMYSPDAKAWLAAQLATVRDSSSLEPQSLEPSDSA